MESLYIEIYYDVKKNKNITEIKSEMSNLGYNYGSEDYYFLHEMEGIRKSITKDIIVGIFLFNANNLSNFIDFLKVIKRKKYFTINVIYYNNGTDKLIYSQEKKNSDILIKKESSDTNFIREIINSIL